MFCVSCRADFSSMAWGATAEWLRPPQGVVLCDAASQPSHRRAVDASPPRAITAKARSQRRRRRGIDGVTRPMPRHRREGNRRRRAPCGTRTCSACAREARPLVAEVARADVARERVRVEEDDALAVVGPVAVHLALVLAEDLVERRRELGDGRWGGDARRRRDACGRRFFFEFSPPSSSPSDGVARRTMSAAFAAALRGGGRSPRAVGDRIEGGRAIGAIEPGLMAGPVGESTRGVGLGGSAAIWPTPGGKGRMETVMLLLLS